MQKLTVIRPSSLERTFNCPGSLNLSEFIPSNTSSYAEEGTLAHELASKMLKGEQVVFPSLEMRNAVTAYVQTCLVFAEDKKPYVELKLQRKLAENITVEGTTDFAVLDDKGCLTVIDLKYGKGIRIEAKDNHQLNCYMYLAYRALEDDMSADQFSKISHVRGVIVQPRLDHVSMDRLSVKELSRWAVDVLLEVKDSIQEEKEEYNPGRWCQFCAMKPVCPALLRENHTIILNILQKEKLAPKDVSLILRNAPVFKAWLEDVRKLAIKMIENGEDVPFYKIKPTGRRTQVWCDEEEALAYLRDRDIYVLSKPTDVLKTHNVPDHLWKWQASKNNTLVYDDTVQDKDLAQSFSN